MKKLPTGVYPRGKRFLAAIPKSSGNIYLKLHDTIEDALNAIVEYKKLHNLPDPKPGRPKKK